MEVRNKRAQVRVAEQAARAVRGSVSTSCAPGSSSHNLRQHRRLQSECARPLRGTLPCDTAPVSPVTSTTRSCVPGKNSPLFDTRTRDPLAF
eukprot:1069574-Rhodomonas_salina.2